MRYTILFLKQVLVNGTNSRPNTLENPLISTEINFEHIEALKF